MAPPHWASASYAALWIYLVVVWGSPTGHLADGPSVLLYLLIRASLVVWGVPFVLHVAGRVMLAVAERPLPAWRWRWAAIPATLLVGLVAQDNGLVWKLRWWQARAEFDAIQAQALAGVAPTTPRWVGTFRVTKIQPWFADPRLNSWPAPAGTVVYWLGWPDSTYSDSTPALINSTTGRDMPGWPVSHDAGDGWFACMDPT